MLYKDWLYIAFYFICNWASEVLGCGRCWIGHETWDSRIGGKHRLERDIDLHLEMHIFVLSYQSLCLKVKTEQLWECIWLCTRTFYYEVWTLGPIQGVDIFGFYFLGLALLVFCIVDTGFFGYTWVSLFLFCFSFGLQVLENFSSWVVGVCSDHSWLLLWVTPVIEETRGSESVSDSLKVMPIVSVKARIQARSIRPQTHVV